MAISFTEMHGSPNEIQTLGSFSATRTLRCAWADRNTLAEELLDEVYPDQATLESVKCARVNISPFMAQQQGTTDTASYESAILVAEYEAVFEDDEEISIEPTAEFLTIGAKDLRWTNNAGEQVEEAEAPGKLFVGLTYRKRDTFLTEIPFHVISYIGHVNASTVRPTPDGTEHLYFSAETLLYNPPSISRVLDKNGNLTWNIEYTFIYKPNWESADPKGWNYYWRADAVAGAGGKFDAMYAVGGNQYKQFPTADFTVFNL